MTRVLVTDGEQRSTLAVVRSLGKAGRRVEVISTTGSSLAGSSRYCAADHRIPSATVDPEAFVEAVGDLLARSQANVLIPMTDASAAVVLSLKDRLPTTVIPFPEPQVWAEVSDKARLMETARELGVPVPDQFVISQPETDNREAREWAARKEYPVVVKPHRSAVVTASGVEQFGVRLVADVDDLQRCLVELSPEAYPVLLQERIDGPGLGGFFLASEGHVTASFAHIRLREKPPTGGVSVLRESIALRDDVREFSEALLAHYGWSGVAMVEFKEDSRSGRPYLMEINGRFWGSLQLSIDAGVDFPRLLVDTFAPIRETAERADHPDPAAYALGVRTRWLWGDLDHLLWILRAPKGYREGNPSLPGRVLACLRFLCSWRPRQRLEILRLSDIRPFLHESKEWVRALSR